MYHVLIGISLLRGAQPLSKNLPPSLHQSPREGGQGDRLHIRDKPKMPRGWVGGKRCTRGVAEGGENKKERASPPLLVFPPRKTRDIV